VDGLGRVDEIGYTFGNGVQ